MLKLIDEILTDLVNFLESRSPNITDKREKRKQNSFTRKTIAKLIQLKKLYTKKSQIITCFEKYNIYQKQIMLEKLHKINPYKFETLINELLLSMQYNSIVTNKSNDLGVDLVATIKIGITEFTEIIQVKRQKSNIQRPVLDQLRGALPYFNATKGTIITLGDFSAGCKEYSTFQGAYPINLINGVTLIDLLFENKIGITVENVKMYSIINEFFDDINN